MGLPAVVLYQPEIPQNAGNIIRLCANTGAALHLIAPLGFDLDDRRLRRAGLDYHEAARVHLHTSLEQYITSTCVQRVFAFTTRAGTDFDRVCYRAADALLFGPESRGLPAPILAEQPGITAVRIPMLPDSRSMNLANSAAVALYEAWRQQGFTGAR